MVATPYSGAATRTGHYAARPSVPGLNKDHLQPDPEPDIFNPVPDLPPNQAGYDVWIGHVIFRPSLWLGWGFAHKSYDKGAE